MKYAGEPYSYEAFKAKDYESLPKSSQLSLPTWSGESTVSYSRYGQREPKFMGEKPKFNKNKF
jgi:hypothetical protein